MRVIVDTNVLMSGIFWPGLPTRILDAWKTKKLTLVLTEAILSEYRRVGDILFEKYAQGEELSQILELITVHSEIYPDYQLQTPISADPDDDKFFACAIVSDVNIIISGDHHLLDVSPYGDIEVLKPRAFVDRYLRYTPE